MHLATRVWPEVCFWQKIISYFGGMNKKMGGRGVWEGEQCPIWRVNLLLTLEPSYQNAQVIPI